MEKLEVPSSYRKELEGKFLKFKESDGKRKLQIVSIQEVEDRFSSDKKALEYLFLNQEGEEKTFRIRRNEKGDLSPKSFYTTIQGLNLKPNEWVEVWCVGGDENGKGFDKRYKAKRCSLPIGEEQEEEEEINNREIDVDEIPL